VTKRSANDQFLNKNKVRLIKGGSEYFDLLEQVIDNAQSSIHLQTYIYDGDDTGVRIAKALIRAAQRKVRIFVMVDAFASQHLPASIVEKWTEHGIHFKRFMPLLKSRHFYLGRRLHHKVTVIDKRYGLVTGINISNRYNDFPDQPAWMDWAIWVEGETAAQLDDVCVKRGKFHKVINERVKPHVFPAEDCPVRVRVNDWVRGRMEITGTYLQMFRQAKKEIVIMSSYFLPGREFRKNLRLAARRGVEVKVIVAGISDVILAKDAERYLYQWLHKRKIRVFEYNKSIMHAKLAVSDRSFVTIGSYNLNDISARASIELNLDVDESTFAAAAADRLDEIMANDCEEITEKNYNLRWGAFSRIKHNIAFNIFRFLLFVFTFYFKQRQESGPEAVVDP
jgi:cardiolipin synthase